MTIFSIDETVIWSALDELVTNLSTRPELLAVVLFGSLATGRLSVGSDVDLLLIVSAQEQPFLDRPAVYAPARFPVDLDLFVYTTAEVEKGQRLALEALAHGRVLWQRPGWQPPAASTE